MRISDWSSDVCSSDLFAVLLIPVGHEEPKRFLALVEDIRCTPCADVDRGAGGDRVLLHVAPKRAPDTACPLALGRLGLDQRLWLQIAQIGRASCRERVCQYV